MVAADALYATDFSDYGFPSTYKCEENELLRLLEIMMADIQKYNPEIIVMEIADGVLQKETEFLLSEPSFKKMVDAIALTADSAPSALYTVGVLEKMGYQVKAVSGAITSSPLYVKEFEKHSTIPVLSSTTSTIKFGSVFSDLMPKNRSKH